MITTKPFTSRRQLHKCYALLRQGKTSWDCAKWLKETENVKKLPESVTKKDHSGIIIALYPDEESVRKIQQVATDAFGEPVDDPHLTLKYLGKVEQNDACFDCLARAVLSTALGCVPADGLVSGVGRFFNEDNEDEQAVYLSVDSKDVGYIHNYLCSSLGIEDKSEHGLDPHVTIGYANETPDITFSQFPVRFDTITLCYGDIRMNIPLVGPEKYPEESKAMSYRSKAVWTTAYINDLPDSAFLYVEPGKKVNGRAFPLSKRHFPYKDASGKIDLPHLRNAIARIPQSNAPGLNKDAVQARARKLLGVSNKSVATMESSLTVFKQADGKLRWVLFSSNPYKDRDGEYVTQLAHERDIAMLDRENYEGQVLRLGHIGEPYFEDENDWTTVKAGPGADIGQCDFAAMHGRIRIESGTFYNDADGRAIADHVDEIDASQAFAHPKRQPDRGGGFLNIKSFERSLLTPRGMASNLFTSLIVSKENTIMDAKKLKAFKDLGVDIDTILNGAEKVQKKADKTAPYRMKADTAQQVVEEEEIDDDDEGDISSKLDKLTAQMQSLQQSMKESNTELEPEERLEDLLINELTVGELQDIIGTAVSTKSIEPMSIVLKAIMGDLEEIKTLLTSKSVQSVVDEVARMKAKLERQSARLKATASKVRELDDEKPRIMSRGVRPSESDETFLLDEDAELSQKAESSNPFSWIDTFIQKP